MKDNGKGVKFSNKALEIVSNCRKSLDYIEALIEKDLVKDYNDREMFVKVCDNIESGLEHLKSEVINNDKK